MPTPTKSPEQQAQEMAEKCAAALYCEASTHDAKAYLEQASQIILHELQLTELLKDKARLDWLERHVHRNCLSSANELTFLVTYFGKPEIDNARQAIDSAMSTTEREKE